MTDKEWAIFLNEPAAPNSGGHRNDTGLTRLDAVRAGAVTMTPSALPDFTNANQRTIL